MAQAFSDRDGYIWMDGKIVPWREANVHVLTHGLHYASAVFEGERCYSGNIFKDKEHSDRLIRSAEFIDMKMTMTSEEISRAKRDILDANKLTDAYLRPVAWRGSEQMGIPRKPPSPMSPSPAGNGRAISRLKCAKRASRYKPPNGARPCRTRLPRNRRLPPFIAPTPWPNTPPKPMATPMP